uniref:N-acetylglucosamine-6-sulfatase n=1 Tax=Culex pipiens TaxID=7175 RepID=A0A8D8MLH6_CULPI
MDRKTSISLLLLSFVGGFVHCERPNFILIVTDDQDIMLKGMNPMAKTQQLVANRGATFMNAFTTSPICCPSRSALLSGQYAHNTKTFNNSESGGCYGTHWREKVELETVAALLAKSGYSTFYAGKYLNEYHSDRVPSGWTQWYGLHGNSRYYNYTLNENGQIKFYQDEYLTDLLKTRTLEFITSIDATKTPFFAMVAPPAPHAPFTAADRHQHLFPDVEALKTKNFNLPCGPLEKHWLLTMPPVLSKQTLTYLDTIYRNRWRSLMAVDELVESVVSQLESKNLLNNTYIFYTSDNGYHIGQFSLPYDKRQPYETDIRVPFLVAGPKIAPKSLVNSPVALIDIAPTIAELAQLEPSTPMDGKSILSKLDHEDIEERQLLIEYWGEGSEETYNPDCPWQAKDRLSLCSVDAECHCQDSWNNTYSCVRHMANDLDLIYCRFKDRENFAEAYDLSEDLYQMKNVAFEMLPSVRAKYDLAIVNLTECVGETCKRIY